MRIEVAAGVEVERPADEVFAFAVAPESFPRFVHALGPIPAIARIEVLDGRPNEPGARRRVTMSDGSEVLEEVLALDPPRRHAYRWISRPVAPLHLLVRGAEGEWRFAPTERGTHVNWTYTFDLTTPLVWPLAFATLQIFRLWMQRALDRLPAEVGAAVKR
ncbi:MAG TPA: SRPBCC family protein [Candidatus Binatia bacterium]